MDTLPEAEPRTRLALLGTLAEIHRQTLVYDLDRLQALVAELEPDLLCAEVTPASWEGGDLSAAAVEVREALNEAVATTDIVLVPVSPSGEQFADFSPPSGWRKSLARLMERILQWGQRKAGRPEVINGPSFGIFCHTLCWLIERTWSEADRQAWEAQNEIIAENILQSCRRDPGRRVLVVVQCQRLHRLAPLLEAYTLELDRVPYPEL